MSPLITVAVPVYNELRYIEETMNSLVQQEGEEICFFLCDNHSTDGTFEILQKFAAMDKRIVLHRMEKNVGIIPNFDFPLRQSSTPYFMWMGAHDVLKKGFFTEAIAYLKKHDDTVLYYPKSVFIRNNVVTNESVDSDLETDNIPAAFDRIKKVIFNLNTGTAVHGIFKTSFLKKYTISTDGCDDLFLLFAAAAHGSIKASEEVYFLRRVTREETAEETMKRYIAYGYTAETKYNLGMRTTFFHIKELLRFNNVSYMEKIKLLALIKTNFQKKLGFFTWNKAISFFLEPENRSLKTVSYLLQMKLFFFLRYRNNFK